MSLVLLKQSEMKITEISFSRTRGWQGSNCDSVVEGT